MRYVFILALAGLGWFLSPMLAFVIVLSMFDANVELAIEIDYYAPEPNTGWASHLRCWKPPNSTKWYYLVWRAFMGGVKLLTGYHAWRIPTMLIFFHLPFFAGLRWTWRAELAIVFWFVFEGMVEDYLWFFFHPRYGAKGFITEGHAGRIWWMPKFWGPFPAEYYSGFVVLAVLGFLAFHR